MEDDERFATARRLLSENRDKLLTVSASDRLRYALSILVCGDDGAFTQEQIMEAERDDRLLGTAHRLILEADLLPELSGLN